LNKQELRSKIKKERGALDPEFMKKVSETICERFTKTSLYKDAKTIAVYMSIKNEVDLMPLIKRAFEDEKNVLVPVINPINDEIFLAHLNCGDTMKQGLFGIPEPENAIRAKAEKVDVMLVPGLAFDYSGARIGWGKGYYDRLSLGMDAILVGVAYEFQICGTMETEPHDVKMHYIIDESEMVVCV